jgi:hypothetical protein
MGAVGIFWVGVEGMGHKLCLQTCAKAFQKRLYGLLCSFQNRKKMLGFNILYMPFFNFDLFQTSLEYFWHAPPLPPVPLVTTH